VEIEIDILGKGKINGLLDNRNPVTARALYESLPLEGTSQVWQDEVYFPIPLEMDYENPSSSSKKGDLSYWPPGHAFCIFFGDSQPASPVNHVGLIMENMELFQEVGAGEMIIVRRL
jgi:uncharacterized protein